jgi:hypothetical protein
VCTGHEDKSGQGSEEVRADQEHGRSASQGGLEEGEVCQGACRNRAGGLCKLMIYLLIVKIVETHRIRKKSPSLHHTAASCRDVKRCHQLQHIFSVRHARLIFGRLCVPSMQSSRARQSHRMKFHENEGAQNIHCGMSSRSTETGSECC